MLDTAHAGQPLALIVDTGAAASSLDLATAPRKYGVTVISRGPDAALVKSDGRSTAAAWGRVAGLKLGGIECPTMPWYLIDLGTALEFGSRTDNLGGDGLLGMDLLSYFAAWVDTRTATLWLRDPVRREPTLQGEWRAERLINRFGAEFPGDTATKSLTIHGIDAVIEHGAAGKPLAYKLALYPTDEPKGFTLSADDGTTIHGVYRITGDELVVCAPFTDGDNRLVRPTGFDPSAGKVTLITYKRVRPAGPGKK